MSTETKPRNWTPVMDAEIERRFRNGQSYSVIGKQMGFSRSAIAGRCSRLGLRRAAYKPPPPRTSVPRVTRPVAQAAPKRRTPRVPKLPVIVSGPTDFTEQKTDAGQIHTAKQVYDMPTRGQCRYPIGNPGCLSFRYCPNPCDVDASYCEGHQEICYDRSYRRRRVSRGPR